MRLRTSSCFSTRCSPFSIAFIDFVFLKSQAHVSARQIGFNMITSQQLGMNLSVCLAQVLVTCGTLYSSFLPGGFVLFTQNRWDKREKVKRLLNKRAIRGVKTRNRKSVRPPMSPNSSRLSKTVRSYEVKVVSSLKFTLIMGSLVL